MKKVIATTAAPGAIGPYSQAIDTGAFVFASGQIPINPATGTPCFNVMAVKMAESDRTDPTERSMPPEAMMKVMPMASSSLKELASRILTIS